MKIYAVVRTSIYVSEYQLDVFTSLDAARAKFEEHRAEIIPDDYEEKQLTEYHENCFAFDSYETGNLERVEIEEINLQT